MAMEMKGFIAKIVSKPDLSQVEIHAEGRYGEVGRDGRTIPFKCKLNYDGSADAFLTSIKNAIETERSG